MILSNCTRLGLVLATVFCGSVAVQQSQALGDDELLKSARQHKAMFDDAESISDYTKYLTKHPNEESVRLERAEELVNESRLDECIADYKILIKSKDKKLVMKAAGELGKIYQKRGNYKEAIQQFKLARSLGVSTLLVEISECALASGDAATALETSNEIMKREPLPGRLQRANAYMKLGQPKLALEDLNYLIGYEKKYLSHLDREKGKYYEATKEMTKYLGERAKCFDMLKEPKLAAQDRKEVLTTQKELYNESPFIIKEQR